MYDDVIRYDVY